jgi:lysophospholipase L1-like esterase
MFRNAVVVAVLGLVGPALQAQEDFFFKKGDRVVFLGDSITEQYQYSSYIELYLTTRFPQWNMSFVNAGIGGDTAGGGANRFQSHVLDEKPTAVTIDFGMNDGGYGAFNPQGNKNFVENTRRMLALAKKANVRVALISPNAVDRRVQDRFKLYLETQKQFYAPLREAAQEFGAAFVDQYATTRAALERMEKDDPEAKKVRPFGDGFHTSPPGGLLMAYAILTGLHAPAQVSDVTMSLGSDGKATGCKVEEVRWSKSDDATQHGVTFTRTDAALPLPIQKDWLSVLPYMNDLKDFNWYGLTVTGLAPAGEFKLSIDKQPIGVFSGAALAQGINVGNVTTGPIYDQGQKVLQALNAKNAVVALRFGILRFNAPDWLLDVVKERRPVELAKRTERIQEMQANVYQVAQPTPHRWELMQVK